MCYWMLFKRPSRFACFKQASPFPTVTLSPLNQQRRRGHICCNCADTKLPITAGKLAHYSTEIEGLWLPTTIFQHCTVVSSLVINNIKMFQRDNILRYINCAFEVDCMICVRSWQSIFRPICLANCTKGCLLWSVSGALGYLPFTLKSRRRKLPPRTSFFNQELFGQVN